ncbi:hypothetical protein [Sulfuriroseicoccus oceanibius]|uniref:Uncharacterized protein n=1 Tax=Sulfuriroseicoccus oceanibius TaxID=2707525 RepID=A0A6B3LFL2_9BACT|nr:hypothetical protein [Sulfuriroseicoccus oceanibius]QQL45482.1 hypothetical protein G3M56_002520 [Sulfuriroseicoccus oceanibius]
MKKLAYFLTVVASMMMLPVSAQAAGEAEYVAIAEKAAVVFGKVVDQLVTVKDDASADAAVAAIEKITKDDVAAIAKEAKGMKKPSPEINEAVEKAMEGKMQAHFMRMMPVMMELQQKPELMEKLDGAMQGFSDAMENAFGGWDDGAEDAPAEEAKEAA